MLSMLSIIFMLSMPSPFRTCQWLTLSSLIQWVQHKQIRILVKLFVFLFSCKSKHLSIYLYICIFYVVELLEEIPLPGEFSVWKAKHENKTPERRRRREEKRAGKEIKIRPSALRFIVIRKIHRESAGRTAHKTLAHNSPAVARGSDSFLSLHLDTYKREEMVVESCEMPLHGPHTCLLGLLSKDIRRCIRPTTIMMTSALTHTHHHQI
jgi:hypothetical protein